MKHNWTYKKLEKCLEKVKYTSKIPSSDYLSAGLFPIVSQEEGLISGYWDEEADVYKVNKPVVIFGDHTRILKYVDFDFVLGADGVKILQPIDGLSAKFLLYYLQWCNIPSLGYSRHYKLLKEIELPVLPLSTQSRIVSELDLLQSVIDKQKAQLKEYDTLAQSIFYDMFGDNNCTKKNLGEVVKVQSGLVNPLETPYCDMIHIGPANIESHTGKLVNLKTAKEEKLISGKYLFDPSMVLYSKIRPNLNKVTIASFEGICSADMYPLKPTNELDKSFLLFILKQKDFLDYAVSNSGRANIPKINREALLNYKIILPPLPLQQAFAAKIEAIEKQKKLITQSIAETQTLFDSRMEYYFGE